MSTPVLTLTHVSKAFGGTRALVDANLSLYAGQVTALLGENGAGKSTLVKILAGLHQPDRGEIQINGRAIRIDSAAVARDLGISIVHQECVVFDNLSAAENILINARPKRRGFIAWGELRKRAAEILQQLDAPFDAEQQVGELSIGQKHLVQIARGLSSDARIMVMDEPTAALSHREVQDLYRIVGHLKARGCAVLFISHRFEEIFAICDHYTVFRDGCAVGAGTMASAEKEQLLQMMVGRTSPHTSGASVAVGVGAEPAPHESSVPLLQVEKLCRAREFHDVCFSLRRGEILGVYGLVGAGRTEVMQCLFGLTQADSGQVLLDGQPCSMRNPDEAIRSGLAYVPEDRQHQGAILSFSVAANIALPNLQSLSRFGFERQTRMAELAEKWIAALEIKTVGPHQCVAQLSGGNQQKVVLAKWLAGAPRALILDEPTKGIDVGAKAAVHSVMRELAAQGLAIIMVSSELPEVLTMSDRIIVMRRGRVRAEFAQAGASAEKLAAAATGP